MPLSVYHNLIESVHRHLPALYRYYDLRRRKMRLREIHHYDTYVPILAELQTRQTWNEAVEMVLGPAALGRDYCDTLARACGAAGATATRTAASRAGPSAPAPTTATRTSS